MFSLINLKLYKSYQANIYISNVLLQYACPMKYILYMNA